MTMTMLCLMIIVMIIIIMMIMMTTMTMMLMLKLMLMMIFQTMSKISDKKMIATSAMMFISLAIAIPSPTTSACITHICALHPKCTSFHRTAALAHTPSPPPLPPGVTPPDRNVFVAQELNGTEVVGSQAPNPTPETKNSKPKTTNSKPKP